KTTLLRVLAGLLKPTAGTARLDGTMLPGGAVTRSLVGVISHQTLLYSALSARENVMFAARLHGTDAPAVHAAAALGRMGLSDRADVPVRALSRGMQQRVSISRAMVHSPRMLLADEPYTGLDESGARALTGLLQEVRAAGTTVVLVTHNLAEGLALATHAAVLRAGKLVRYDQRSGIDPARYADTYRETVAGGG
ncbi:MAG: ABC transporter ATP-binding protein, partial [Gemmatimonadaceae bacterium]|nr:ABC transporter ATP-binding protein [Gemmatimonadaceae bacterium]